LRISFVISVEDHIGYQQGLPALLNLFESYKVDATILFSLGYDNSGLNLKRLFRPAVLSSQLPFKQKLQGTLLPPLNLAKSQADLIKSCAQKNHDLGICAWDSVNWQLSGLDADRESTRQQLVWSIEAFEALLGQKPHIHGASGLVINKHLLQLESQLGFDIAVDTRGKTAFYPTYHDVHTKVINLPVTLPGIEEYLQLDEIDEDNVHEYLLVDSQKQLPQGHIMHLRAAYEGRKWLPVVEKMIVMWRSLNWEFCRLTEVRDYLINETYKIPNHQVGWAAYPPGKRYFATQGIPSEQSSDQTSA